MRWTDRQQAMLREMGLRLWQPATVTATFAAGGLDAPAPQVTFDVAPQVTFDVAPQTTHDVAPQARYEAAPPLPNAGAAAAQPSRSSRETTRAERPLTRLSEFDPERLRKLGSGPSLSFEPVPANGNAQRSPPLPTDAARHQAIAEMDWPTLRAAVADCTACGLCRSRQQTVFGVGHERAQWMIVGEAPGEQEDLAGEPFVGAAGRLLDRMLLALGLTREASDPQGNAGPLPGFLDPKGNEEAPDASRGRTRLAESLGRTGHQVYIANTLKCRPPRNRNPEPQELAQCLPFLERQVALIQPRLILAMGRFAVQALLGSSEPIGRLRGKAHQWHGVPVVVTYHPAYLLRQPTEKARAWADLCLAAEIIEQAAGA